MFLMPRCSCCRRISLHYLSLSPLSAALVSDTIRTLRILNSKLQNMLSGRYKSKVGPARVRRFPRGERVLYPLSPSPGFYSARGKGFFRAFLIANQAQNIKRERPPSRIGNEGETLYLLLVQRRRMPVRWCSLQTEQMDRKDSNARYK